MRPVVLAALAVSALACQVEPLSALGRPCAADGACGPGSRCDPASWTCVVGPADGARDLPIGGEQPARDSADDLDRRDVRAKDLGALDKLAPDAPGPDLGPCPASCASCVNGTCIMDCASGCTCPKGWPCSITCAPGSCNGTIHCGQAASCAITCNSTACTGIIECDDAASCTVDCVGTSSCTHTIKSDNATSVDITCSGSQSCGGSIQCADASQPAQCNVICSGQGSCANMTKCGDNGDGRCFIACTAYGACAGQIDCAQACACSVSCAPSCAGGLKCPAACAGQCGPADGCDSCP